MPTRDMLVEREKLQAALKRNEEQTTVTNEVMAGTREIAEKFFYQIALISSGTIVLSVTFLGYLQSDNVSVHALPMLLVAWGFLLLALLGALYRNHHFMRFIHFTAVGGFARSWKEAAQQTLEVASADPTAIVNIQTPEERAAFREAQEKKIKILAGKESWSSARERRAEQLLDCCQWAAHLGLIFGLILLLIFAGFNVWRREAIRGAKEETEVSINEVGPAATYSLQERVDRQKEAPNSALPIEQTDNAFITGQSE